VIGGRIFGQLMLQVEDEDMWVITTDQHLVNVRGAKSISAEYEGSHGESARILARYPEGTTALLATVHGEGDLHGLVDKCLKTLHGMEAHHEGVCNLTDVLLGTESEVPHMPMIGEHNERGQSEE